MLQKNDVQPLITTAGILLLTALIGTLFSATSFVSMLSLAFALFAYTILPGYCILLNFKLSALERIIFGMPISITLVSVTLYTLDIIGIRLSLRTTLITIAVISLIGLILKKSHPQAFGS